MRDGREADDLVGIGGRLREGQVGDDAHAGYAHAELMQSDGLHDRGHAHAVGADCVGMSTVMEAIALHQLGVRVAGMSIVSDLSFAQAPTDPDEVVRLAAVAHATIAAGIEAVLAAMS